MPTSRPPKTPTTRPPLEWIDKAPRGMWYEHRKGKALPFVARWRAANGRKESRGYPDAEARATFAADWLKQRAKYGDAAFVDKATVAMWEEFARIVGSTHPLTVARQWIGMAATENGAPITVADAVTKYLAFRNEGKISADTRRHFDNHLRVRFAGEFGKLPLHHVTDDLIIKWLASLKHPRTGEPMESVTRRHHRKDLNTFLDYCFRVKRWITRNPCEGVPLPPITETEVKLLTVEEGRHLFAVNEGNPVVGRMALEAFGFLRASSAGRIRREDIRSDLRGIRLRGAEHKSDKTKFRQGQPDNLWAWLNRAPDETWAMPWWKYRNEKRLAFGLAGLEQSENRLRKTCISAHLAWVKNPALTSRLAQHRYTSTTEIYEGVMDEKDAEAWFRIGPHFMP